MKLYRFVGPKQITDRIRTGNAGVQILSSKDVRNSVRDSVQELSDGFVMATFVIDASGVLLIADRRSEHVVCGWAAGSICRRDYVRHWVYGRGSRD